MDNDVLYHYIDARLYRRQFANLSDNPELVQSSVNRIVREQITKLESFHAAPEIKRAIKLGRDPEDIIIQADRLVSRGSTPAQVSQHLHNQNEFLVDCAREFYGGSLQRQVKRLRNDLRLAEDIEGGLINGYIFKKFKTWQDINPGKGVDMTQLSQWENEARAHIARKWNRFMNTP